MRSCYQTQSTTAKTILKDEVNDRTCYVGLQPNPHLDIRIDINISWAW